MKEKRKPKSAVVSLEDQEPMFSEEFLRLFVDYGYETLRAYLERVGDKPDVVKLLDGVIFLQFKLPQPKTVTTIDNDMICSTVAEMSKQIVQLGGIFSGPSGQIVRKM